MKITPLEIRQKSFEKNFRGYDKDEVHGFLMTLSQEWEKLQDENKELRMKLESSEREVTKLREVESSLYKTLKTAEDTGANVIDQARKAAELHLKESQLKADGIMHEAKSKARDTIEESEMRAKEILADMEDRLKSLVENYKKLESSREDLISDLKRLGSDLLDKVERARATTRDFDADKHFSNVRREATRIVHPNISFENNDVRIEPKAEQKKELPKNDLTMAAFTPDKPVIHMEPEFAMEPALTSEAPKKAQKSFFDEIG